MVINVISAQYSNVDVGLNINTNINTIHIYLQYVLRSVSIWINHASRSCERPEGSFGCQGAPAESPAGSQPSARVAQVITDPRDTSTRYHGIPDIMVYQMPWNTRYHGIPDTMVSGIQWYTRYHGRIGKLSRTIYCRTSPRTMEVSVGQQGRYGATIDHGLRR